MKFQSTTLKASPRRVKLRPIKAACADIIAHGVTGPDGTRIVRRTVVSRLARIGSPEIIKIAMRHGVPRVLLHEPVSKTCTRGYHVYYPVDAICEALRENRKTRRSHWTAAELDRAVKMFGLHTLDEIAVALGRSRDGVKSALLSRGVRVSDSIEARHGLITTTKLARIMGRSIQGVLRWVHELGCPAVPRPNKCHSRYLFDLKAVRAWLLTQPLVVLNLHPRVLDSLQIDITRVPDAPRRSFSRQEAA